jgi:hypothetical protein
LNLQSYNGLTGIIDNVTKYVAYQEDQWLKSDRLVLGHLIVFLLAYILIVIVPYMHLVYFDQIHHINYYSFLSFLPHFTTNLMVFIILFSYMHTKYFDQIHYHHSLHLHPPLVISPHQSLFTLMPLSFYSF